MIKYMSTIQMEPVHQDNDFDLNNENNRPQGITYYDDKFWIVDT